MGLWLQHNLRGGVLIVAAVMFLGVICGIAALSVLMRPDRWCDRHTHPSPV
jgi:hypothetical protein